MSKTKIKRKTTGFDILYRVVTAIMAIAAIPVTIFSEMILIVVMHEDLSNVLNNLTGSDDPGGTYFEWGITDIFSSSSSLSWFIDEDNLQEFSLSTVWGNEILRAVVVAVALFAVALVITLVIFGFAVFSNKIKVITGLSVGGIIMMIASWFTFTNFFAAPITSGEVTLSELLNQDGIISGLVLGFFEISSIKLEGAFFGVMFLLIAILVWSVSIMIVNASDEKEKAEKAMARERNK